MIDLHHGWNASYKPAILGFVFSLILSLAAYLIIVNHHLSNHLLKITIIGLGIAQAFIQLIFFLHLGLESKPRWNLLTFLFALLLMCILAGGSIWIIYHLNYNMMLPMEGH